MKYLPAFIRRWAALLVLAWVLPEAGGVLLDYDNNRWTELKRFVTREQLVEAQDLVINMRDSGRDRIYVARIECYHPTRCRGYFVIHPSNGVDEFVGYAEGVYDFEEAANDVVERCHKIAFEMGYRLRNEGAA